MTPEQSVLEDGSRRHVGESGAEVKTTAGFFSSARTLTLPLGRALDPQGVVGYPIDLTIKAQAPRWPPRFKANASYVALAQYGLGCYERFLAGDGSAWLQAALSVGRYLVDKQEPDGSWLNQLSFPHTFPLVAPWRCGMAQGEGASLLVRLYQEVGEPAFAAAAQKALAPLYTSRERGGVCARLHGAPWPEEYPTDPPSFVLNGAMFAWWGMRDVAVGLGDDAAARAFQDGADTLAANLHRFDTGSWSLYCLARFPVAPIASSFYHVLHITQLEAMHALAPRPEFELTRQRWLGYLDSRWLRSQAMARKVLYRLIVPRNRFMANRLPWARPLRPKAAA
jgi:hypothetical protein